MKEIVVSSLIGYLFGCFQTSIFISKIFRKTDIREHGSKNAGASNTTVVLGLSYGALTAFLDIAKSAVAIILVQYLYSGNALVPVIAGVAAVLGHIFPVFFGFKGGKGVAPLIGTVLAIDPVIGVIVALVSVVAAVLTDYVVVGSTTLYVLFVGMMILRSYPAAAIYLSLLLLVVAIFKHLDNYRRILTNEEMKIRSTFSGEKTEHRI